MARREKGTGSIYQRENGTWVGVLREISLTTGKPKSKYFSGRTEAEVKKKIREYNRQGRPSDGNAGKISVSDYLDSWLKTYKMPVLKSSSYDKLENTVIHQVKPNLGMIQLNQLTSEDIQNMLTKLKNEDGYSYSIVKKAYDCMNEVLRHAMIREDIVKNPMMLVRMPEKSLFPKKEIRIFTDRESALITEEVCRQYSTGTPVYVYGDAYILMLNTGLRLGEVIGLEKSDWDAQKKTLSVKRNIQSVKKRDSKGVPITGKELVTNTTKTYSGERTVPLNENATAALERLCRKHPNSKWIVCSSKGEMVPPERVERTFYRILKNLDISQAGTHSLRHTFASLLFAEGVDIKTVSTILGHASIQITLNTYIHLLEKADHNAVAKLDDVICST